MTVTQMLSMKTQKESRIRTDRIATYSSHMCVLNIQGVSGGIVNILGGGSMDYSE